MPCCGQVSEEDIASVAAIGRSAMSEVKAGAGMVALITTVDGMSIDVPPYGRATHEAPCFVPESEVEALCAEGRLKPAAAGDAEPTPPKRQKKEK